MLFLNALLATESQASALLQDSIASECFLGNNTYDQTLEYSNDLFKAVGSYSNGYKVVCPYIEETLSET